MKKALHTIPLILAFLIGGNLQAQQVSDNAIFYHAFRSPASSQLNPALFPNANWYVSLPKLDLSLSLPICYDDLGLRYDPAQDATIFNVNNFLDKICANGFGLATDVNVDVLGFGFKLLNLVSINVQTGVRVNAGANLPTGLFEFLSEGNGGEQRNFDFGTDEILSAQAYAYASVGAGVKIPLTPLTIGARLNVLDGLAVASADHLSIDLATADDFSSITLTSDYIAHTAGMLNIDIDDTGRFSINPQLAIPHNFGFTFDLGLKATLNNLDLSLSLLDVGPGVHWQENTVTIVPERRGITASFDGVPLNGLLSGGTVDTSFISNIIDSVMAMIDYTKKADPYWYSVPSRLYFGASYTVGRILRVGYLFQGRWSGGLLNNHGGAGTFRCNNTLSLHLHLTDWFELSASNAATFDSKKLSILNPGAAVTIALGGCLQLYVAADYVSSLYLTELKAAHLYLGLNLMGKSKK